MAKPKQLQLFALMPNPDFDLFWEKYPRREAKLDARETFEKVVRSKIVTVANIIAAVEKFARHVAGRDPDKIPLPATWLNAGRWDDEYSQAPTDTSWKLNRAMEETMRRRMQ